MTILVCSFVAFVMLVIGIVIGGLSAKATASAANSALVNYLGKFFTDAMVAVQKTNERLQKTVTIQDKLIQALRRENKLQQRQLDSATDHIAELESIIDESSESEGDDEDEHSDDHSINVSLASDKLVTIQKLLEDASSKNETIDPKNLLGIVNFKKGN